MLLILSFELVINLSEIFTFFGIVLLQFSQKRGIRKVLLFQSLQPVCTIRFKALFKYVIMIPWGRCIRVRPNYFSEKIFPRHFIKKSAGYRHYGLSSMGLTPNFHYSITI